MRRRLLVVGILAAALVAAPATALAAGSSGPGPAGGTASAIATSYKLNPTAAGLSLGISVGVSLSDYTNQVARAESRAVDLGIIGTTLTAEGCDGSAPTFTPDQLPQPLDANSSDPKAAQGYSQQEQYAPVITKSVRADNTPSSEANTTSLPIGDGKTITLNGAHSRTFTHLIDGKTREAVATVDVGEVEVAGVVRLSGLHWEAIHHSGADQTVKGTFSIGSLSIAGNAVPTQDPTAALVAANTALAPLGVQFQPPVAHLDGGIQFVDPLAIAIVPSPTRDGISQTVLGGAQPVRQSLYDALFQASCKVGSPITVTDIVVGSITGAGQLSVELGGVQASTAEIKESHFFQFGDLGGFGSTANDNANLSLGDSSLSSSGSLAGSIPAAGVASEEPLSTATSQAATPSAAGAPTAGTPVQRAVRSAAHPKGSAGALAAVGGVGLLLVLAMAEGDRRAMRRAQRTIPVEG